MKRKTKKTYIHIKAAVCVSLLVGALYYASAGAVAEDNPEYAAPPAAEQPAETGQTPYETDILILVNKDNMLPEDFIPEELCDISGIVPATKSTIYFNERAAHNYYKMIMDMREDGITGLYAVSGYRTYSQQRGLYNDKVRSMNMERESAEAEAGKIVAPPGTSEHQTGLALDVSARSVGYTLDYRFTKTAEYEWLANHSHEYGFIIRYQEDKTELTGIIFEPWHLRYVGCEAAVHIYEYGLCLEEYLQYINEEGAF